KKLGLENKQVLAKAKELGIAAARVASSSLDKITAEYLEQQLIVAHPEIAAQAATPAAAPAPTQAQPDEGITIVRAPEPPAAAVKPQAKKPATMMATAVREGEAPQTEAKAEPAEAAPKSEVQVPAPPPNKPAPAPPPPPPPEPAGPRVGDKIGFI